MSATQEHTHEHAHGHAHGHGYDYSAANRDHFDEKAKELSARADFQEVGRQAVSAVVSRYGSLLDPNSTTLMDFACGSGLVTLGLLPHFKSIVGVDVSKGMLALLEEQAKEKGISPEKLRTACVELKGEENELDGERFDVVLCSQAYHHFADVEGITKLLVKFLKPGGSLIVIDQMGITEDIFPEDHKHVVPHTHGFVADDVRRLFEGAGLRDVEYNFAFHAKIEGFPDIAAFIARGVKPSA